MKLLKSGLYKIRVYDDNGVNTGTYGLTLWRIHPPNGKGISYGTNIQDTIKAAAAINGYTFNGNVNDIITLLIAQTTGGSSFYLHAEIYAPDGSLLRRIGGYTIRIDTMKLLKKGVYSILIVDDNGVNTGTYGLNLRRINPLMGSKISYGTNIQDTIKAAAAIRAYTFDGNVNDIITLLIAQTTGGSSFYLHAEIYAPDGSLLRRVGGYTIRIDTMKVLKKGVYSILVVDDNGVNTGTYGLTLWQIYPPMGKDISYGTNIQDTIKAPAAINAYIFNGYVNDIITLLIAQTTGGSSFYLHAEIYAPDGSLLRTLGGYTIMDTMKLLKKGVYSILVVDDNGVNTGTYGLNIPCVTGQPHAKTITGPENVNAGFTYSYSVPFVGGNKWKWKAPGAVITPHKNTADILWDTLGQQTIKVVQTNENGCTGAPTVKDVNVYPLKITNVEVSQSAVCPGSSFTVTAKASGVYDSQNTFTAQLSDASGNFSAPINIGSTSAGPVGNNKLINIDATVPAQLEHGTGYRIRIKADSPVVKSSLSGKITVKANNDCDSFWLKKPAINITKAAGPDSENLLNVNDHLQVFPNPTSGTASVVFIAKTEGFYSVKVTDVNGKILLNKTGRCIIGKNKVSIDINNYVQGIYFVNFNDAHTQRSLKLVKE